MLLIPDIKAYDEVFPYPFTMKFVTVTVLLTSTLLPTALLARTSLLDRYETSASVRIFSIFQPNHESQVTPAVSPAMYPGLLSMSRELLESDSLVTNAKGEPAITPTYGMVSAQAGSDERTHVTSNVQRIIDLSNIEASIGTPV